jgi:site-specific recombinase XerD
VILLRKTDFTKAITEYFSTYLPSTCGVSPNTSASYRDAFKLLLLFFQEEKNVAANGIELRLLDMKLVSEFLNWLEISRGVLVTTRNQRLAAIKAFAHFIQYRYPEYMENYADIINMRPKKHEKTLIPFLTEDELSILFAQPDTTSRQGLRDLALLVLLYDSGARVQELVDLELRDIRLTNPAMITLTGKGRKARQVPLMKDTCKLMDSYIQSFHRKHTSGLEPLFFNEKKNGLTRYGITYILKKYAFKASPVLDPQKISPHVLRHTKAMHLLRAGVNMIYIRDFLGHVDISTTEVYARIDAEMKRKVFEETVPNFTPNTTMPWEEDEDLLQWLTQFGKKAF